jgi:hypothetical protein
MLDVAEGSMVYRPRSDSVERVNRLTPSSLTTYLITVWSGRQVVVQRGHRSSAYTSQAARTDP